MPWEDEVVTEPPPEQPRATPAAGRWATPEEERAPAPPAKPQPEMPGAGSALLEGAGAGMRGAAESIHVLRGQDPTAPIQESPAAAPMEWSDVWSPYSKLAPKLAYGLGHSAPTLAAGLAGGLAGSPLGPGGILAGGALGAGAGAAMQSIGPVFGEELRKSPQDPDGAWSRATQRAAASGVFSALGWGLFPAKIAEGPLKQIAFQAFGIQPAVAMGEQATQNVIQGKPVTEDLGQAYAHGAVGTAIPMAGHAILGSALHEAQSVAARRANDPVLGRLGEAEEGGWKDRGFMQNFNRLYTAVKDDLNPIREAEKYITEGRHLTNDESAYIASRTTRGSYGKAEHFLDYGTFDPVTNKNTGEGLKQVFADPAVQADMEGFRKYLLSRRAVEKESQGVETGIPLRDATDFVMQNPQFAKPFRGWTGYHDHLLDYLVKAGVVGEEHAANMREANRDYVPFYRLMDEGDGGPGSPGRGVYSPIKRMTGSQRQILDPIESAIKNTYLFISIADRNIARQKLQALAEANPVRGKEVMEKIPQEVHPIEVTQNETARAMAEQGLVSFPTNPEAFTIFRPHMFNPGPDKISVFNDGKRSVYKVDPYLAAAVNGLDNEGMSTLTKMIAAPARLLRAGATLSPEFIARNPMRDQFSAFIFSTMGRGYVPFYDFLLGAGSVLTKGEGYQNWLKSGGANSAMVSIDRNYVENLVRRMKDPSFMGTVKNVVKSPLELLRAASETMENATRVGENMRLLKRGATPMEAGYASREVTLDFQRIGSKMRAANAMVAFLNAQMEGVDRAARSMAQQPLGFAAKVGAAITLPSLYLWWANKDDPRVKEIPRWEKDMFWIYPTDNWQPVSPQDARKMPPDQVRKNKDTGQPEINKGNIYRIPKPFELGVMFGSVPERILDAYYAKNPQAFKDSMAAIQSGKPGEAISQAKTAFSEMDPSKLKNIGKTVGQAFLPNYYPQIIAPAIEQYANRSMFTDRPLVPKYLEGLLPQQQANPYTTDTAKLIGKFIGKIPGMEESNFGSPIIVENYVRSWTGGLGRYALDLSDAALHGAGITPTKINPTMTNADKAGIKAFAVRYPEGGANSVQDFYEESEKRARIKRTITHFRKSGDEESARELQKENVIASAEGIKKAMGAQFKLIRDTYNNTKMSAPEKRQFIDMSYFQIIKMAQIGNAMFKKTDEAFKARQ